MYTVTPVDEEKIKVFLVDANIPALLEDHRNMLEEPRSIDEIEKAIASLKCNTALGPDGLTLEFYKKFSGVLLPFIA